MTPYADLRYFLFLLYPLGALLAAGVAGRLGRATVLLVGLAVVAFQYADPLGLGSPPGSVRHLLLLGGDATASTVLVLAYAHARRRGGGQATFYAAVALALSPLLAVKLLVRDPGGAGFFDSLGFLGVSYLTLRAIDAIIAVHDGVLERPPRAGELLAYLLFAPTLSAGPIDRFRRFRADLDALPRPPRDYTRDVEAGIHHLARGFLYKFIVAEMLYRRALVPLAARSGVLAIAGYMYAYSAYLFFDFAGYSAFAIGVGRFFAIRVPENFRLPFLSRNFREMWDRWHITLSWWLRDHVYMRFMLVATRRKWLQGNRRRAHALGLMLTMTLMGCWHGLRPQYVVYGAYQGAMLVAYDAVGRWNRRRKLVPEGRVTDVAGVLLTANLFCFGLLIFSGRLFPGARVLGAG